MNTLFEILGKLLTPSFGGYVLIGLGLGIAAGLILNAVSRFASQP
jgi:hypothetical protein